MHEVTQTILANDPDGRMGNCLQAAIASILDLDLDQVPHFAEQDIKGGVYWWNALCDWAEKMGYQVLDTPNKRSVSGYTLACGKSPRGYFNHIVVAYDGETVWDPYPGGTGVERIIEHYVFLDRQTGMNRIDK